MTETTSLSQKLWDFLSSLKFAVLLLSMIALFSIPATLVVQNQQDAYYLEHFPGNLGHLIVTLEYHRFFSSPFFLILLTLFWFNLLLCTAKRLTRQLRLKRGRRFGPDILHMGIQLLLIFAVVSGFSRREGLVVLTRDNALQLPSGNYILLKDFILETYPDGRPKLYSSQVTILTEEQVQTEQQPLGESFSIEVNHPLRVDGLTIYQYNYYQSDIPGIYNPGLMVVQDKMKPYILLSLLVMTGGLILTLIQRKKR